MRITLGSLFWLAALAGAAPPAKPVGPVRIPKPLVAWWTFDEDSGLRCADTSGAGNAVSAGSRQGISRVEGIFGNALSFSGRHRLHVPARPDFSKVKRISLSAWVMPTAFEQYNEIFRKEDGNRRVLFSFQERMHVLSLGLNVGGYAECDARIAPAQVMDGDWHHCCATYNGRFYRVYLDGREIGKLNRPGAIAAGGPAAGCIGSANGGECFQGAMDDLRIYAEALTAEEVTRIYQSGVAVLARLAERQAKSLAEFYVEGKTFAETLAGTRRKLAGGRVRMSAAMARAAGLKLRARFPDECAQLLEWTGTTPIQYLTSRNRKIGQELAGRLVGMLTEYKPLTTGQWARLSAEERATWRGVEAVEKKYQDLVKLGEGGQFSPEWIRIALSVGPRIHHRPRTREAVAPYVEPSTPVTRDLTAAEARAALERDWLHQAGGNPTLQRLADEIRWAVALAGRIRKEAPESAGVDFSKPLAELATLQKRATAAGADARDLYLQVRRIKRGIQLANPVVDFDTVLFVDMPYPRGSEWPHETRHRLGYMAVPGARLLTLQGLGPRGKLRQLMPQAPLHGSFWRPDVSWDAKRVVFCFKPHNEKAFHLYEILLASGKCRQLTDGIYDDLDPIYLPDGEHIIFSTTRSHTYVRCMPPTNAYPLARCDRDGGNIYLITRGNEPEYTPSVLGDGRVIYTRWEYTDKPLWRCESLWTMNPDGTSVATFWGNQSVWPDLLKDARAIPNSRRVMFTGSAHHNWFSGSVGILDPAGGLNFPHGLTKVTADTAWPECGNGPTDPIESPTYHASGRYAGYYSPYPLGERDFLVSANRGGKFVLYLMDTDGNRELIHEGVHNIFHAMPLKARPVPPVIEDRVAWPSPETRHAPAGGTIYSANVYAGAPAVLRGKAKFLRVLNIEHKTYTYWYKRPYLSTGPVVSGVQSEGVKRVLGTVPIEADGSVYFHAPSGVALHFQLLDERHRALQTMRSFTGVMPGESRGCLGCHERHSGAPTTKARSTALARGPAGITPPPWGADSVSYARYVRPVLDKYCAKCHTGEGKGRKKVDFTPRPGKLGFDETYWLLTGQPAWGRAYHLPKNPPPGFGIADMIMVEGYDQRDPAGYATVAPMTKLSYKSRLIALAGEGKHHDVKLAGDDLLRLILWVDTMCPYRGSEEVRAIDDPEFQGIDWLSIRPKIKTAPRITRPGPVGGVRKE